MAENGPKKNAAIEWLRGLVSQIPESPNTLSILNMLRAGSNTALNWLDATNRAIQGYDPRGALEQGDVLAPLGIAAMGAPFAARGAIGSAGGRLTQGGVRRGTEATADRLSGSASPNQRPVRQSEDDLQGRMPVSIAGPEGLDARSSMTS